jgi:AcrR family transcriptional regulator
VSTVVANPERRDRLADAGLAVLAREGARGVTYRSVEREAGLPAGTTSNYFRSRDDLMGALAARIYERLAPDPGLLAGAADAGGSRDAAQVAAYMSDIRDRLTRGRDLFLALVELRLEATRRPALAPLLTQVIHDNYEQDVAFHERAGLPGGRREVQLLHLAMTGLMLELLTTPTALGIVDPAATVASLTTRLLPGPPAGD